MALLPTRICIHTHTHNHNHTHTYIHLHAGIHITQIVALSYNVKIDLTCSTKATENEQMLHLKIAFHFDRVVHACLVFHYLENLKLYRPKRTTEKKSHNSSFHFLQTIQLLGEECVCVFPAICLCMASGSA